MNILIVLYNITIHNIILLYHSRTVNYQIKLSAVIPLLLSVTIIFIVIHE